MGYQKFVAVGNVTADVKTFKDTVAKFGLAVNGYKDNVTFFNCVGFSKRFHENSFKVLTAVKKGSSLLVEGEFQAGEYEKDGQKQKTFDLVLSNFQYVGARQSNEEKSETATAPTANQSAKAATKPSTQEEDDSVPF